MLEVIAALLTLSLLSDRGVGRSKELMEQALTQRTKPYLWRFYVVFERSFDDDCDLIKGRLAKKDSRLQVRSCSDIAEAIREGLDTEIGVSSYVTAKDFVVAAGKQLADELLEEAFEHSPADWRTETGCRIRILKAMIPPNDSIEGTINPYRGIYYLAGVFDLDVRPMIALQAQKQGIEEWIFDRISALYGADDFDKQIYELALTAGGFRVVGWHAGESRADPYLTDIEMDTIEAYQLLDQPIPNDQDLLKNRLIYDELRKREREYVARRR